MTFQDTEFFSFLLCSHYFNKKGKSIFLVQEKGEKGEHPRGPSGGKLDLHKLSLEIKNCPFMINEERDKTREQIHRGRRELLCHQPSLSWLPFAGEAAA